MLRGRAESLVRQRDKSGAALIGLRSEDEIRRTRWRHGRVGERESRKIGRLPWRQRRDELRPGAAARLVRRSIAGDVGLLQLSHRLRLDWRRRRWLGLAGVS